MSARLVVRPRKLTIVCWVLAVGVVLAFVAVAVALGRTEGDAGFRLPDQVAMVGLGVLMAGAVLLFTRARVVADDTGVRVRNGLGETALPWQVVAGVRFDDGEPWATLDLQDDDTVALLAVQANDGARAVDAVVELRRLLRASRESGSGG